MASKTMKLILGATRDIPFEALRLSQANVRRIKAGVSVKQLADDIGRRGLLTALTVRPVRDAAGEETGLFEVPAGGRRFRALDLLVKGKRLARTAPVPCVVKGTNPDVSAEDDSLAENIHREPLHPLDQFRAFAKLAEQGQTDEEIAARWFVTPAIVRQRLRLTSVSPQLLDLYAENVLTLDQLMAFTVTADHARQEQVWEQVQSGWNKEAYYIRSLLTQGAVQASDRRARLVGLDAYEAAGGTVSRDLFTPDGGGWLEDPLLLDRLALEKLDQAASEVRAEGWRWVEVAIDFPYGHRSGLRTLVPIGSGLSDDEEAERTRLEAELDAIEAEHADSPDDLPDEVDRRLGEIEQALDALGSRPALFEPSDVALAGAFVSLGSDGRVLIERGFLRAADEPRVGAEHGRDQVLSTSAEGSGESAVPPRAESEEAEEGERPLPERLLAELSTHRTLALRDAVGAVPEVALTLLLHKFVRDLFGTGMSRGSCLDAGLRPAYFPVQPSDLKASPAAEAIATRQRSWSELLPLDDDQALWDRLATMADKTRMALLAHCVGAAVNAYWERADRYGAGPSPGSIAQRNNEADRLARVVQLDMAEAGWRPTADNYLGRVTKSRILDAVREAKGEMAAQLIDHLKKSEMAKEAERLLADTGWLPEALRMPTVGCDPADAPLPAFLNTDEGDREAKLPSKPFAIAAE